jgi:hypothetical protein
MRPTWRSAADVFSDLLTAGHSPESAERTILNDLVDGRLSSRSVRQTGRLGFNGFVYSRPVDPQHEHDSQAFWVVVRDDQWLDGHRVKIDFTNSTVSAGPRQRALLQICDNLPIITATLAATETTDSAAAVVSAERVEDTPQRTGLPGGPPKGREFIRADLKDRMQNDACEPKVGAEAAKLIERYIKKFPTADRPALRSVENYIRDEYQRWKTKKKSNA